MPHKASLYTTCSILSPENIGRRILPLYNLEGSTIEDIKFKNTDKQRAVYKVTSDQNTYCLKKVYYNSSRLLFVYSAIEWWYQFNINVPRILPTKNNSRYVNYNDMLFILTPWIEGEKCNYDNNDHINSIMPNLGKMHHVAYDFFPIPNSQIINSCNILYNSLHKHWQNILQYSNLAFNYKDSFSKLYIEHFNTFSKLGEISSSISYGINNLNLTKSLCHGDYVNKNIIFYGNSPEDLWVIDFDKVSLDYVAHDISYALRRILKRDSTKWNTSLAISLLSQYNAKNKLNIDDYRYILAYLSFPQKYWKISRDYYRNIKKCNKKSFYKILKKSVLYGADQLEFSLNLKSYIEDKFGEKI
ncbi:CotS family spore coat protein [Hathewaya histolytica]|uniref:Protein CotS1 n=1 Tax=Hathewaya histolytica TaxID=1498 RepID=A0A4U9RFB7_HATHI|nr:CotS family spore coat protein [Hathewaya histolytica]VTQ90555.1 protein CotS1 [Hathewaya histolytica]